MHIVLSIWMFELTSYLKKTFEPWEPLGNLIWLNRPLSIQGNAKEWKYWTLYDNWYLPAKRSCAVWMTGSKSLKPRSYDRYLRSHCLVPTALSPDLPSHHHLHPSKIKIVIFKIIMITIICVRNYQATAMFFHQTCPPIPDVGEGTSCTRTLGFRFKTVIQSAVTSVWVYSPSFDAFIFWNELNR